MLNPSLYYATQWPSPALGNPREFSMVLNPKVLGAGYQVLGAGQHSPCWAQFYSTVLPQQPQGISTRNLHQTPRSKDAQVPETKWHIRTKSAHIFSFALNMSKVTKIANKCKGYVLRCYSVLLKEKQHGTEVCTCSILMRIFLISV